VSTAEYQRRWRAKRGARTGQPGRPQTEPCGTVAAYRRHERHQEPPCGLCRAAHSAYQRELYRRRKMAEAAKDWR
jgi:hypothetical protein